MQDAYLLWVCYVVLFFLATFCALALPLYPTSSVAKVASEGTWQVVFVVFLAYAMMPLKSYIAAVFGILLCAAHLGVSPMLATEKKFEKIIWQQVSPRLCLVRLDLITTLGTKHPKVFPNTLFRFSKQHYL